MRSSTPSFRLLRELRSLHLITATCVIGTAAVTLGAWQMGWWGLLAGILATWMMFLLGLGALYAHHARQPRPVALSRMQPVVVAERPEPDYL